MLSQSEKEEVLSIKVIIPSNEEILAKRLAIALEALERIAKDKESFHSRDIHTDIASDALKEIEEVK